MCYYHRRRVEYGLLEEPSHSISDEDLISLIRQIQQDMPYSGVQMICGSLRSRGLNVSRERIRSTLRAIDPLGGARRWPAGLTRRRPYSVPAPNSLWHIGEVFQQTCVCTVSTSFYIAGTYMYVITTFTS